MLLLFTAIVPNAITPDINFTTATASLTEQTAATTGCRNYRDYSFQMSIANAPVGDAAPDELFTVAYSPDGTWLAASGNSGAVHVWNADSRELVRSIDAHQPGPGGRHSVRALAFLNDRQIVSGGSDGFVRIWEVSTGTAVQTCEPS